jgi:putative PEP-CTERM system integral membrane protein
MATDVGRSNAPEAIRGALGYLLFWTYNLLWVVFDGVVVWSIAGFLGWSLTQGARELGLPTKVLALFGAICVVPLLVTATAFFLGRSDRPARLLRLLYGVEVPIQGLLFLALLFLRQATPVVWLFAFGSVFAASGLVYLSSKATRTRGVGREWGLLLSQTVGVLLVAYVLALFLLLLPIGYAVAKSFLSWPSVADILTFPLPFWVVPFSLLNGVMSPIAAALVYQRSFREQFAAVADRADARRTAAAVAIFGMAFVALGVLVGRQPALARIRADVERFRAARSFAERQAAARHLEPWLGELRRYLVGVYLAPYRYVLDEAMLLELSRTQASDLGRRGLAAVQQLATPFVYRGRFREDARWAAEAYKDLFNEGIQNGEHEAIETTLEASFTRDALAAGLLDRYRKMVRVVSQEVRVEWDRGCAVVTITEEYQNETDEPQEAFYEFSLSGSAAVTGLWLGPDLEFEGVIAPRGAAREVYEAEVRRRVDPALVEHTGPRQYRLRVFPIPRKVAAEPEGVRRSEKPLRASFRYVVLPDVERGSLTIPLPRLNESRNVFWDESLAGRLEGPVTIARPGSTPHWSGGAVLRLSTAATRPSTPVVFRLGDTAATLHAPADVASDGHVAAAAARRIAVMLDASHSSAGWDWRQWLREDAAFGELVRNHSVEAYFFGDALSDPIPVADPDDERLASVLPLGRARTLEALEALCEAGYDSILILSVGRGVGDGSIATTCPGPPVAIVHADGHIPAYGDALSARVVRGCGVHDSIASALPCLLVPPSDVGGDRALGASGLNLELSAAGDLATKPEQCPSTKPLCQLLAHKVALARGAQADIEATGVGGSGSMTDLHELALRYHVLTPSSSLIALVWEQQRRDLEAASQGQGAFAAHGTGTEEALESPAGQGLLNVRGVPEPETWMLLSVGAVMLALFLWRQRTA